MKMLTALVFAPALLALSAAAQAASCVYPQAPQALPNGAKATKEEMLAAQGLVKEYAKNVQEVYLVCLDKDKDEQIAALNPTDPDLAAKKASIETIHAKKYNSALDELQALVDRWNAEKKAFGAQSAK
jgi:opacity protein-like surface antigen